MNSTTTVVFFILFFSVNSILIDKSKEKEKPPKKISVGLIIAVIFMTVIPGVQFNYGYSDIRNYIISFYNNSKMSWADFLKQRTDSFLFFATGKVMFEIGGRILAFSALAFIMSITFVLFIKKEEKYVSLFICSLTYLAGCYMTCSFNIFRQGIAMCIVMFGLRYVYDRKLIKFLVCITVAVLFHSTAFFGILLYVIYGMIEKDDQALYLNRYNLSRYYGLMIVLGAILITFAYVYIIEFLTSNISFFERYAGYVNEKVSSNRDFYVNLLLLAIFFLFRKSLYHVNPHNRFMLILFACACVLGGMGFRNPFVKRIAMYFFYPSQTMLFGSFPFVFKKKNSRILAYILISTYLVGMFVFSYYIRSQWQFTYDLTNKPY